MRDYFSVKDLKGLAVFAAAYVVAYGYGSLFAHNFSAPLWFPDSVLLCALLLAPRKKWWLYLVIAATIRFVPQLSPPAPIWFLGVTFINDGAKAALSASLLQRALGEPVRLNTVRKFAGYLGVAVLLVPMLSAFAGAASRRALGYDFWPSWSQWFLGDALTNVAITPALLLWLSGEYRRLRPRMGEAALWCVAFAICLRYALLLTRSSDPPIGLYVPVPFLIWAAARLGAIGASSALSATALFIMLGIAPGFMRFSGHSPEQNVLFVQLFLGIVCLPILFVSVLIDERQAVEQRLRESQEELNRNYARVSDLAGRLISAQEDERKRIARELHDDVSQRLAVLMWGLDTLAGELPERMVFRFSKMRVEVESIEKIVRDLSHELHSATLRHLGIVRALEGLCQTVSQQYQVEVDLQIEQAYKPSDDVGLCLFRVTQEALNNAVKHGKATHISVKLAGSADVLRLEIRDSGVGFHPATTASGLGLVSMQERLRMLGGRLHLQSSPGQGTVVEATVPCPDVKSQQQAAS